MEKSERTKARSPKRIGIDARFYGPLGKGLGRYIQEIVDNVVKMDKDNEYVIFLNKDNYDEFEAQGPGVRKVKVDLRWYTAAEQILFPFIIAGQRLDLMHFPHFNVPILTPVKFVVTIHDLILTKFPTVRASTLSPFLYRVKNFFYRLVIKAAVMRAEKVIAVSEFTKKDVIEQFGIDPDKVAVTPEGVADLVKGRDSRFVSKLDDKETLLGYNIRGDFLLYVGNAYPHKNLESLIEVFSELLKDKPGFRLVLVGKEDYFYKRIKDFARRKGLWDPKGGSNPVVFTGYVPDSELEVLYKKAAAYVFSSLYEGFGLPPLEAMARGCPVASSKVSSMPEVLGEAAHYFDPGDRQDMLDRIKELIDDKDLRRALVKKGFERVKRYDWFETSRKTLDIYKQALRNGGRKR